MFEKPKPEGAGRPSQVIEVLDLLENITISYNSMREASRVLNISSGIITTYFKQNQQKPYKARYVFTKSIHTIAVVSEKLYPNAAIDKVRILLENKDCSGIYLFTNKNTGKQFIGSAVNLRNRFTQYYSIKYLERYFSMRINRALLKYGHENFTLTILEYCLPEKCLKRKDYYIDLLKPEYNILPKAGSRLCAKVSSETRKKIFISKKGKKNPFFGKTHSQKIRDIISTSLMDRKRAEEAGRYSQMVEVFDLEKNQKISFKSLSEAARALNLALTSIRRYLTTGKVYKKQYTFKLMNTTASYNILPKAGSRFESKISEETRAKTSGFNNYFF